MLGLAPQELARLMRENGARAINELQQNIDSGGGSALDQILRVNLLRVAMNYSGMMEDGNNNNAYAEQIANTTFTNLQAKILALAPAAAKQAVTDVRDFTYSPSTPDQLTQETFTKFYTIQYALDSPEFEDTLGKTYAQRLAALGMSPDEWSILDDKRAAMEEQWKEKIERYTPPAATIAKQKPDNNSWGPNPYAGPPKIKD